MAAASPAAAGDTPVAASPTPATTDRSAFLADARHRFQTVAEAESLLRAEQLDDKRFRASEQWPVHIKAERKADKRPCLTVNRLPQFIKQVTGEMRSSRPAIQVNPVDDHADPETAEVFQGIIRHIETASHAQVAYDTAADDQVTMGRGYIRLVTEYEDATSFNQGIRIRRIRNAHHIYMDPMCVEADYGDAMYGFEVEDLDPTTFKAKYPQATISSLDDFESIGDQHQWWVPNGAIRVADYFYVEYEDVELVMLEDGTVLPKDGLAEYIQKKFAARGITVLPAALPEHVKKALLPIDQGGLVKLRRTASKRVVHLAKITGAEVLEETVWPGSRIPIFPVVGDEINLDGRIDYRGIVRDAKDQQRVYNYQVTSLVETIALAPRAPWVVAEGQVEPYKRMWNQANTRNFAYLPYKPQTVNGLLAPAPQRQSFEPAIQAIVAAVQQADNDLKATTGMYDASLGQRGPQESGKAILARQKQGEVGNSNYTDNLGRALWAIGTALVEIIPKIYDAPRVLRIIGKDENKQQSVMVHAGQGDAVPQQLPRGVQKVYDLSVGRYDVVITPGTNSTRRQQAVEMMTQAIQGHPEILQYIGDLYFGSMDWPQARQIAERLKKMLPKPLQEDGEMDPNVLKAELGQAQQQLEECKQLLQQASEEIRTDKVKALSQKEIAQLNAKVELIKLRITTLAKLEVQDRTIAAAADSQQRDHQLQVGTQRREHLLKAGTQRADHEAQQAAADADRRQHQADTILDAEINELDTERQMTEQERIRAEQRDDVREQRAHEDKQAAEERKFQAQQAKAAAAAAPKKQAVKRG